MNVKHTIAASVIGILLIPVSCTCSNSLLPPHSRSSDLARQGPDGLAPGGGREVG
jgi:hypothetical protein